MTKAKRRRYTRPAANTALWRVTHPDGRSEVIRDLAHWCRAHDVGYRWLWGNGSSKGYTAVKVDAAGNEIEQGRAT